MPTNTKTPPNKHTTPLKIETSRKPPFLSIRVPFTGGPIRAARAATAIPIPIYVPILRVSLTIEVKAAVPPEMIVPEVKPNAIEYTTNPAVVLAWSKHKMVMPVLIPAIARILKRPNLSARIPGMTRPNVDAALRIASRYEASVTSMPCITAYVGMKNNGANMPRNKKNCAAVRRLKAGSLNAAGIQKVDSCDRSLDLTATQQNANMGAMTNPMIRTDHPKPSDVPLSILERAIGMTIPPMDDPDTAIPRAEARFLLKYCETAVMEENIKSPILGPTSRPCTSMKCQ